MAVFPSAHSRRSKPIFHHNKQDFYRRVRVRKAKSWPVLKRIWWPPRHLGEHIEWRLTSKWMCVPLVPPIHRGACVPPRGTTVAIRTGMPLEPRRSSACDQLVPPSLIAFVRRLEPPRLSPGGVFLCWPPTGRFPETRLRAHSMVRGAAGVMPWVLPPRMNDHSHARPHQKLHDDLASRSCERLARAAYEPPIAFGGSFFV